MIESGDLERLVEIQEEIQTLVGEASNLIRMVDRSAFYRAESYWLAHITVALSNDSGILGGSMVTMQDTIDELRAMEAMENSDDNP